MVKKVNFPYVIFVLFIFFILFSFYFILDSNENTKNNYTTIEKSQLLISLNKELEDIISKKLQYLDNEKISETISSFENESINLEYILTLQNIDDEILILLKDIKIDFSKKKKLLSDYKRYNELLVDSMQRFLEIQAYIQKRYYFSPIGLEVNTSIVNLTQAALGKDDFLKDLEANVKKVKELAELYKLSDDQLSEFIEKSHATLKHLDMLKRISDEKKNIDLDVDIKKLKSALVVYFQGQAEEETDFSYFLVIIIICFLITLVITYEIDKKNRRELLEQTLKLNEAQEYAHLGSWEIDFINNKIYFSDEMHNLTETSQNQKDKINIDSIIKLIYPKDRNIVKKKIFISQQRHEDGFALHRVQTKSKKVLFVENKWHNQYNEDGKLIKTFGVMMDITSAKELEDENKRKEEILYQQSKMVAMGEMIGNIAHQWRQPLSIITTSATGMKLQKEFGLLSDEQFFESVDSINENAQYLSETINDFKNFIKGNKEKLVYNISDTLNSFIHLVTPSIKSHHIKVIENADDDIRLEGYPNELMQCFINIFNNSKDALDENEVEEKLVFISTQRSDTEAIVTFKDNAGGIPNNILSRIFEPYFTTKHKSQGTGLGLHMTYKIIVEGMQGTILAKNVHFKHEGKLYKGAEFIIKLPL